MTPFRRIAGFVPYALIVFLNAFVDLGHKIVIQNTVFKIYDGQLQIVLTAIVNALILLPFILLFSPAGFIADKYPKHLVIRAAALAAVGITLLITVSYYQGWFVLAFLLTLLLAVQSALYSPAKYGYMKELVGNERLAAANGIVQATTIVGILLGTFVFSVLFESRLGAQSALAAGAVISAVAPIGWCLVALSMIELVLSFSLPRRRDTDTGLQFDATRYMRLEYLKENVGVIRGRNAIWLSIIGLATFWGIAQVVLAAFPAFAKLRLGVTNTVVIQGLLACSGAGIILGSLIAARMSKRYIETGLIPVGALGVSLTIAFLPALGSVPAFALAFLLLGTMGGMFIIPLNSLIQFYAGERELGLVLAGNNWVQNVAMLGFLGLTVVFALTGIDSVGLFYLLTLVAFVGTGYTVRKLPHSFARIVVGFVLKRRYRIDVVGFNNLPATGPVLLLGNHISWIDWALVQLACPRPVRFVMQRQIFQNWYLRPLLDVFGVIPISSGDSAEAVQEVNRQLRAGEVVCVFPEGAISRNGHLGRFHTGYERMVGDFEGGVIIPFYLRGLWGSALSRANEGLRAARTEGLRRDIIVAFGEPLPTSTDADQLKQKVFELSLSAWESFTSTLDPVPLAWIRTVRRKPWDACLVDNQGERLSRIEALAASLAFAHALRGTAARNRVGILLPASPAAALANMAALLHGAAAVNLNFTLGPAALRRSIDAASVRCVLSSRAFCERLSARGLDAASALEGVQLCYLEDWRAAIPKTSLAMYVLAILLLPSQVLYRLLCRPVRLDAPAAILFSSGSEGSPKGVMLSHRNIMANSKQISDVLNTRDDDVVMACLPPFHSFGLTVTTMMPLVEGIPTVTYPDPTDVLGVAKTIARQRATVLFGTATFLRLFVRNDKVWPLMLESLRYVVAGAERVAPAVRNEFQLKFGRTIYEGYGCTETTPVVSVNIPDAIDTSYWRVQYGNRPGTVGMPLPGTACRIVDPETMLELPFGEDGLILISGSQLMIGYLDDPERTARAFADLDGRRWYKTGDKGHLTPEGFLVIVDRYSRFAKIGAEMISLRSIEEQACAALGCESDSVVALRLPDPRKGERIVLLLLGAVDTLSVRERLIAAGVKGLMLPAELLAIAEFPRLGNGKLDYAAATACAQQALGETSAA